MGGSRFGFEEEGEYGAADCAAKILEGVFTLLLF